MNFSIKQLNFLYIYNYCKENHLNVSPYDEIDINYISDEDIVTILKFLLFKENIISSIQDIVFQEKVEKFISQPDVVNLSEVGTVLNKKIQAVAKYKSELESIFENVGDRNFIYSFENIMANKKDLKNNLNILNNIDDREKDNNTNNENKKRAANFLFS